MSKSPALGFHVRGQEKSGMGEVTEQQRVEGFRRRCWEARDQSGVEGQVKGPLGLGAEGWARGSRAGHTGRGG